MSYFKNVGISDGANLDAFQRLRTSDPVTVFDSKQLYDAAPLYWDDAQTSGAGTGSVHSSATASDTLSVGNTTAGTRVRQTKRRFNYQPGKSQLIFMTGVLGTGATGITRRVGLFDENNGIFCQLSGTTLSWVVRSSTGGAPSDANAAAQSAWNLDRLNGAGGSENPSGLTLDTSKVQILVIDFEWLGVGRVRVGFVIDGLITYVHEFSAANAITTVYMSTPNLPLRYEISNSGAGPAANLMHICSSVISEGGQEELGTVLTTTTGNTHMDANVAGTLYACLGIRLKTSHLSATVKTLSMSMMGVTANDSFMWSLYLNPTVAGAAFTYTDVTNSACQRAQGNTTSTVTGGVLLAAGNVFTQTSAQQVNLLNSIILGSTIAGVRDEMVLCIMPVGAANDLDIYATFTWRELL